MRIVLSVAAGWLLFGAAATTSAQTPAPSTNATRAICLLVVNNRTVGEITVLLIADDIWLAETDLELAGLGLPAAGAQVLDGHRHVSLRSLAPQVTGIFDERDVRLQLTAAAEAFVAHTRVGPPPGPPARSRQPSAFVNYAATTGTGTPAGYAGELGVSVSNLFFHTNVSGRTSSAVVRGTTSVTFDDERRLVRWIAGDGLARSGFSQFSAAFAGISVSRQFGIDPLFVPSTPLSLSGATAVPAVAEVYVNGQLVSRTPVEAGTYQLDNVVAPVGAGDVRIVLRDEFGRTRESAGSFYRSPRVLRKGLHEFRYAAGLARESQFNWRHSYRGFVGAAEHRVGLTSNITLSGGAEATDRFVNAGGSFALQMRAGELEFGGRVSRADHAPGQAFSVGYGYRGRVVSLQAIGRRASASFVELGAPPRLPEDLPKRSTFDGEASLGVMLPGAIRLTAAHAFSEGRGVRRERSQLWGQISLASATSLSMGIASTRVTGQRIWTANAALTMALGGRTAASVNAEAGQHRPAEAITSIQRATPPGAGLGYQLQWRSAPSTATSGAVTWQHQYGRAEVRRDESPLFTASTATVAGALAVVGGSWNFTRPIDDAFGLVKVGHVAGVRTYVSNELAGRTNRRGELILPSLSSYYGNRVSIEDRDVPIEYEVGPTEARVAPGLRGGSVVSFDVREIRLISGRFFLPTQSRPGVDGAEAIAEVKWPSGPERVPVHDSGGFVFEHAAAGRHTVRVTYRGDEYTCDLSVRKGRGGTLVVEEIGAVPCTWEIRREAPPSKTGKQQGGGR